MWSWQLLTKFGDAGDGRLIWMIFSLNIQTLLHKKMKFCIKDFCSKCDQIRRKLRIWLHLLKKFLMENFIFCAVLFVVRRAGSSLFYSMISYGKKEFMLCIESRHTVHISCSVWCTSHKSNIIKTFSIFIFKDFLKK